MSGRNWPLTKQNSKAPRLPFRTSKINSNNSSSRTPKMSSLRLKTVLKRRNKAKETRNNSLSTNLSKNS